MDEKNVSEKSTKKQKTYKAILRKQTAVYFLIMILLLGLSFAGLYSVKVTPSEEIQNLIERVETSLNEISVSDGSGEQTTVDFVLPESVDVNLWTVGGLLFKLGDVIDIYNGVMDVLNAYKAGDSTLKYETIENLGSLLNTTKDLVSSNSFANAIALIVAVSSAFINSTVAGVIMVIMIVMTAALPVVLFCHITVACIGWLFRIANAEKSYTWMNKCYRSVSRVFVMVLALLLLDSSIGLGWGIIVSLLVCASGYFVSVWASTKKNRTPMGKKYINVLLVCSGIKIVGFAAFFVCLAKTGIIGQYLAIIVKDTFGYIASEEYGTVFLKQLVFVILAVIAIIAFAAAMLTLIGALTRIGGMVHRNKELCIFSTVMAMVLLIVPLIVSAFDARIVVSGHIPWLLVGAFLGTLIMLGSEIALPICRKKYCPELKESEKDAVLRGLETIETEAYEPEEE